MLLMPIVIDVVISQIVGLNQKAKSFLRFFFTRNIQFILKKRIRFTIWNFGLKKIHLILERQLFMILHICITYIENDTHKQISLAVSPKKICIFIHRFSPNRPTGPIWSSSSCNVHIYVPFSHQLFCSGGGGGALREIRQGMVLVDGGSVINGAYPV